MRRVRVLGALAGLVLALAPGGAARGEPVDRLARFGALARQHAEGAEPAERLVAALLAVVDDEILDSLRAGGPFASEGFVQERLDGFGERWGGAAFRVTRLDGGGERGPLMLGALTLAAARPVGSLRVYGPPGPAAALLATATHEGALELHGWPGAPGQGAVLASWLGAPSPGGRALHLELWRRSGNAPLLRAWSLRSAFPTGLRVSGLSVRSGQILIRYEAAYPGRTPGCEGQTEHEDTYRASRATGDPVLVRRTVYNGWHRELQAAVTRFFGALADGNPRVLAELVPDRTLRARLPRALEPEPACEELAPGAGGRIVVAATEARATGPAPWSLEWGRTPQGWRLTAAAPVLQ